MLRGTQVKSDEIGGFALEVRITRGHVAIQPLRLKAVLAPPMEDLA
jgi:hypothetical protein